MTKQIWMTILAVMIAGGSNVAWSQDQYDKVLEDCYRIAGETGIGAPDMQGAVDRIRKWKIEMPPAERLKSAQKKLERIRTEKYGVRTEIAPKGDRKPSKANAGKPNTKVRYPGVAGNGGQHNMGPSKARQEIDDARKKAAIDGARDIHKKTKESYVMTQNEIEKSKQFAAGFDPSKYDTSYMGGNADGTVYIEPQAPAAIDGLDLMAGLEEDPPKEYNVDELIERFQKDEYSLSRDELDYLYDYLQANIDEIENNLTDEKKQTKE